MNRLATIRGLIAATLVAGGIGCKDEPPTVPLLVPYPQAPTPTGVHAIALAPHDNVLSARVSFTTASAPDSVRVVFWEDGAELDDWGTPTFTTLFRPGKSGADTIDVLGLKPSTTYTYRVDAKTRGITKSSSIDTFTTADLPQD